jgi:hypothetical protein
MLEVLDCHHSFGREEDVETPAWVALDPALGIRCGLWAPAHGRVQAEAPR